jgi:Arc/MetJ family transcription regulator
MTGAVMTKRLVELDDQLLEDARAVLGTTGVTDTVREALRQTVAQIARAREIEWLRGGGMSEMADPEVRAQVWR